MRAFCTEYGIPSLRGADRVFTVRPRAEGARWWAWVTQVNAQPSRQRPPRSPQDRRIKSQRYLALDRHSTIHLLHDTTFRHGFSYIFAPPKAKFFDWSMTVTENTSFPHTATNRFRLFQFKKPLIYLELNDLLFPACLLTQEKRTTRDFGPGRT